MKDTVILRSTIGLKNGIIPHYNLEYYHTKKVDPAVAESEFYTVIGALVGILIILGVVLIILNGVISRMEKKYKAVRDQVDKIVSLSTLKEASTKHNSEYKSNKDYDELYFLMYDKHGKIVFKSDMDEIIAVCGRFIAKNERAAQKQIN